MFEYVGLVPQACLGCGTGILGPYLADGHRGALGPC